MDAQIPSNVETVYFVLEYVGVFLAALVGGTVAKRMNFDVVGFYAIALVSALSGGIMRDVLLSDGPAAALQTPGYIVAATAGALVALAVNFKSSRWDTFRFYFDVVTIGVWAAVGVTRALANGLPWISCIVLGVVTATGGAFARDVVLGRIPGLFTSQKMYVFPAVVSSGLMLLFDRMGNAGLGMVVSACTGAVLAMVVHRLGAVIRTKKAETPELEILRRTFSQRAGRDLNSDEDLLRAVEESSDAEFLAALRTMYAGMVRQ